MQYTAVLEKFSVKRALIAIEMLLGEIYSTCYFFLSSHLASYNYRRMYTLYTTTSTIQIFPPILGNVYIYFSSGSISWLTVWVVHRKKFLKINYDILLNSLRRITWSYILEWNIGVEKEEKLILLFHSSNSCDLLTPLKFYKT